MRADKLGDALVRAGFNQFEHQLMTVLANYFGSGGTDERLKELIDVAKQMPGMGRADRAVSGHPEHAQTRQPVEDGVAKNSIPDEGQLGVAAPSSSNRGGEGQCSNALKRLPDLALPVREPKPQRAAIDFGAASLAIKTKLAQSALDRVHTSDGRPWGDVGAHELDGMGRDGALAQALKNHLGVLSNTQRFKTIRDLVNPDTFEAIRSKAHGA